MSKVKSFLEKQQIHPSFKTYGIDALGAMAYGLFASLLIGTILNTIGQETGWTFLTDEVWPAVQMAVGPAIAVAIAYKLKATDLVLFSMTVVGYASYQLGGPVGVFLATIVATELGKLVSKTTKLDILITPSITILSGLFIAKLVGPGVQALMTSLGEFITFATAQQPFIMGILVSVTMGVALTLPISSAAISMMLGLSGLAAGAATVGCCANMVGFAVISYRDNGLGGLAAQGLGTSMLQMPNIMRNPRIWLPAIISSAILGPFSTIVFKMENTPYGAGMGTSGLVGQIGTLEAMRGQTQTLPLIGTILLLQIILPAVLSYIVYGIMRKQGWIKDGQMLLEH